MAPITTQVILGALKALNIPQNACYENFVQMLQALPEWYAVEVPDSISNVIISTTQPGEDSTNKIWIRISGTGDYIGQYQFIKGGWKRTYQFAPGETIWMTGDSSQVGVKGTDLEPFKLITLSEPTNIPSNARQSIFAEYVQTDPPVSPVTYSKFAVQYVGY